MLSLQTKAVVFSGKQTSMKKTNKAIFQKPKPVQAVLHSLPLD